MRRLHLVALILPLTSFCAAFGIPPPPTSAPTPARTRVPTSILTPTPIATRPHVPDPALEMEVSWDTLVEPPQKTFEITIEMIDPDTDRVDWVLGDISGEIATGQLGGGESTSVELEVDWTKRPLLRSNLLYYMYGEGDDGATFAQVVTVEFNNPPTVADPSPTASCGYARFVVTTASDLSVEYPDSSFEVGIANEGIFQCGNLDWWIVEPSLQEGMLSCSPTSGVLEGASGSGELTSAGIQCAIDWSGVPPGKTRDFFLILLSYPRVNGIDSAHLVRIRAARP